MKPIFIVESLSEQMQEDSIECPICLLRFKGQKQSNLKRHLKLHDKTQTRYKCKECERVYQTQSNFNQHKSVHHIGIHSSEIEFQMIPQKAKGIHATKFNYFLEFFLNFEPFPLQRCRYIHEIEAKSQNCQFVFFKDLILFD